MECLVHAYQEYSQDFACMAPWSTSLARIDHKSVNACTSLDEIDEEFRLVGSFFNKIFSYEPEDFYDDVDLTAIGNCRCKDRLPSN